MESVIKLFTFYKLRFTYKNKNTLEKDMSLHIFLTSTIIIC